MKKQNSNQWVHSPIDWSCVLIPLAGILALCLIFMTMPEQSTIVLNNIRQFLGDDCGIYYAALGIGIFVCPLALPFRNMEASGWVMTKSPSTQTSNGEP